MIPPCALTGTLRERLDAALKEEGHGDVRALVKTVVLRAHSSRSAAEGSEKGVRPK